MPKIYAKIYPVLIGYFLAGSQAVAQYTFTGQLRTRTELRDGFGNLPNQGAKPGFFTSQRARLNVGYGFEKLKFFTSIQDVRVWGQDGSTISAADGNRLMLHEMWGELTFASAADSASPLKVEYLGLKLGRQEIVYDDQRLLGNLDWLQQGRRHDAAILKFMHQGFQADLGAAFNQNSETREGNIYVANTATPAGTNGIGVMYKSMQFLYVAKKFNNTKISGLFFKDDFQKSVITEPTLTTPAVRTFVPGVNSRLTSGFNLNSLLGNTTGAGKLSLNLSAYYQGQNDKDGNVLDAYFASLYTGYQVGNMTVGPGFDFYSGNNGTRSATVNRRFDPLYGTPHKFAGYMDYFYAPDGHGNAGLKDFYLKTRYGTNNLSITVDAHKFVSGNEIGYNVNTPAAETNFDKNLGTEIDLIANYNLNKFVNFEFGYAHMFGTQSLERIKTIGFPAAPAAYVPKELNANWAYIMVNIRPDFLFTKSALPSGS